MKIAELYALIDGFAPYSLQQSYDNSGLTLGNPDEQIDGILLTTDVTPEVIDEAIDDGCNVILSHHPVIFRPISGICPDGGMRSEVIVRAIKADIALICAHTNLDACVGGLNDRLAATLGVTVDDDAPLECHRIGELDGDATVTLEEYAAFVSDKLHDPTVRYVGDGAKLIQRVAVSTGAGGRDGELVARLIAEGADVLVTAELKHDLALEARNAGLGIIECTHHATERCAVDVFAELLESVGQSYFVSEKDSDPYNVINNKEQL